VRAAQALDIVPWLTPIKAAAFFYAVETTSVFPGKAVMSSFSLSRQAPAQSREGADQEFKLHLPSDLSVNKNDHFYVYVSNEAPGVCVFVDNLQVTPAIDFPGESKK